MHAAPLIATGTPPPITTTTQAEPPPAPAAVPDLVGKPIATALATVKRWGYRTYDFTFTPSSAPPDTVIRQTPPAGSADVPATVSFKLAVAFGVHATATLTTGACSATGPDAPGSSQGGVPNASLTGPVPVDLSGQSPATFRVYLEPWLVAPAGWNCVGFFAEDGNTEIMLSPPATTYPPDSPPTPSQPGIVLRAIPACQGCMYPVVCPFFTTGETATYDHGNPCQRSTPPGESDVRLRTSQVEFTDPPYVAGTGYPSGGAEQATGILQYFDRSATEVTCALPPTQAALCATVLAAFSAYWSGLDTELTLANQQVTALAGSSTHVGQ